MSPALDFPDTIWTWIEQDSRSPECCEWFCETYRPAVLGYLRRRLLEQDAEDACQDFFATAVIGRGFLAQVDRTKGRLRTYLGSALDHFLVSRHRAATAQKRGAQAWHVPLHEIEMAQGGAGLADPRAKPDEDFDRQWAYLLWARALESARRYYVSRGHLERFDMLLPVVHTMHASIRDEAAALGIRAPTLSVWLTRLRARVALSLEEEVRVTVRDPAMFREELDAVKRALKGTVDWLRLP